MTKQCICDICICGRHRCPRKSETCPSGGAVGDSITKSDFIARPCPRLQSFKPAHHPVRDPCVPFEGETHSKSVHTPKPIYPRYKHVQLKYCPPTIPFEGKTITQTEYGMKSGSGVASCKPRMAYCPPCVPFDHKPWSKDVHHGFTSVEFLGAKPRMFKPQITACPPSVPMQHDSITKNDYKNYEGFKREGPILKKDMGVMPRGCCLEGKTTYKIDYSGKCVPRTGPVKHSTNLCVPKAPFCAMTVHKSEFPPPGCVLRVQPCKPHPVYNRPCEPMECQTWNKQIYVPQPIRPRIRPGWGNPGKYCPPTIPFEGQSDYKKTFIAHPFQPTCRPCMPRCVSAPCVPFDGTSMYRSGFPAYSTTAYAAPKPRACQPWCPPCVPMEYKPVSHDTYRGEQIARRAAIVPDPVADWQKRVACCPISGDTVYQSTYKHNAPICCPAARFIDYKCDPCCEYVFKCRTNDGHCCFTKNPGCVPCSCGSSPPCSPPPCCPPKCPTAPCSPVCA